MEKSDKESAQNVDNKIIREKLKLVQGEYDDLRQRETVTDYCPRLKLSRYSPAIPAMSSAKSEEDARQKIIGAINQGDIE